MGLSIKVLLKPTGTLLYMIHVFTAALKANIYFSAQGTC